MQEIILKAENLVKNYKNLKEVKVEVLKSVSIEIQKGKITMIAGASGAGKSTLLHLLGGLDKADSGNVYFNGESIYKYSDAELSKFRNRHIGFVFQFHHLLPEFTAAENVAIPQMILGRSLSKSIQKALELLNEVGLLNRKDHKPAELSGGEQQRVAIARALANDPSIVFADEPTGNLDSYNSQAIIDLVIQLNKKYGKTFIVVTHNKEMISIADELYEMKDGKILSK